MTKAKECAVAFFCLGMQEELLGFFGFRGRRRRFRLAGFLPFVPVVFALEFLNAARGIDVLHLAGEKRMARRANLGVDVFLGAARDELVAAPAGDRRFFVFWMDVFFHCIARITNSGSPHIIIPTTRKTTRAVKPVRLGLEG